VNVLLSKICPTSSTQVKNYVIFFVSDSIDAQQLMVSCVLLGVIDNSNGGEPTDAKERKRPRALRRYAEMDKDKNDEMLRKRRESYQQKKAKLQCTPSVTCTSESHGGPSALSQLQIMAAVKGAI
jgi:succinate dehydrogenase/fumarate reductase-like Fe-S protein